VRASLLANRRSRSSLVSELRLLLPVTAIVLVLDFVADRLVRFTLFVELRFLPFTLFDVLFIAIRGYSTRQLRVKRKIECVIACAAIEELDKRREKDKR